MKQSEKRNHYTTVKMAPCKICGGTSTGYHFGAITCEACKAFFRRAISKKSYSSSSCQREDRCASRPQTIASCVACRLKRCLDAGMSKEGIRRGRYSIALRTKSILEAKGAHNNKPSQLDIAAADNDINNKRQSSVELPRDATVSIACPDTGGIGPPPQNHGMGGNGTIPHTLSPTHHVNGPPLELPYHAPPLPAGAHSPEVSVTEKKYIEFIIDRLVTLQKMLYPHNELTQDIAQRQKQIQEEHDYRKEAFKCLFGSSNTLVSTSDFKEVLNKSKIELDDRLVLLREKARASEKNIALYIHHAGFIPGFERLLQDDITQLLKAAYNEFWLFSNYASINDDIGVSGGTDGVFNAHKNVTGAFFSPDYTEAVFVYAKGLQKMNLSIEEVAIIRVILLTFTDRCSLKQPAKVENLQMLFIRCLRYLLSKTRPEPHLRFYQIFDRLVAVRDLSHRNSSVNEKFIRDWGFMMEEFPIWKAMMESTVTT